MSQEGLHKVIKAPESIEIQLHSHCSATFPKDDPLMREGHLNTLQKAITFLLLSRKTAAFQKLIKGKKFLKSKMST